MTEKRTHCTVTMPPEMYRQLQQHCKANDTPITTWVRNLIRQELAKPSSNAG
jgi:hypothetical protein